MAVTDPTPTIPAIPLPVLPAPVEPAQVAEAGVSTSEWKVLLAYLTQLAAAATASVASQAGLHLSSSVIQYAAGAEVLGAALVATWILGRSIRKKGTTA